MNKCLPQIIAHRGGCANAPENTLPAIKIAKEMGAKAIEIDVCLTSDKKPIVFHDYDLKRLFNKSLYISEMTYEEVRTYDVGSTFSEDFIGCKIPHLHEVLALCNELGLMIDIELKPFKNNEAILADIVWNAIRTIWSNRKPLCITSFSREALSQMRELNENVPLGLITESDITNLESFFRSINCQMLVTDATILDEKAVSKISKTTNQIYAYTVNSKIEAERLFNIGVKGIFTDKLSEFYVK